MIERESLTNCRYDIEPLLFEHWQEVAANQELIKLNPDWEKYAELDRAGKLVAMIARERRKVVGYIVLIISEHLHYKDHKFAHNDVFYVKPEYRGGLGDQLLKAAELEAKRLGASVMLMNTKVYADYSPLLEDHNFDLFEKVYIKGLF
jgi:GNAT superfamily N-acetyltransferase